MSQPAALAPSPHVGPPADLGTRLRVGWASGSIGTATILNTYSLLLLYFLTVIMGIAPATAGTLLFVAKLCDAFLAPLVGRISDRSRSPMGRRRPFLVAGAVAAGLALVMLFNPPALTGNALLAYTAAGLVLLAIGYSLFNVPYIAMPAEMTADPIERTRMMTWRVAFISLGQLLVIMATSMVPLLGGGRTGFGAVGLILAGTVALTMLITFASTASASGGAAPATAAAAVGDWRSALANRPFLFLVLAKICQLVGLGAVTATLLFFIKGVIGGSESLVAIFGLASTAVSIASMPLWSRASRRFGKRNTYIFACVAFSAVTLSWLLAGRGEPTLLIVVRGALLGASAGGLLLMGQSILPDTIAYDAVRTGHRREGLFAGAYSFVEKASMAFGPLLIGALLQVFGFDPKAGVEAVQSASALRGVYVGMAILPAALYLLSIVPLLFYDLTPEKLLGREAQARG